MKSRSKSRSWLLLLLAPPLVAGLLLLAAGSDFAVRLENLTLDARFRARADSDPPADERLFLVGVGEGSLKEYGRWPWSRRIHGGLAEAFTWRPPRVLAFDFLFTEPSRTEGDDEAFGDALSFHPGAVTGTKVHTVEEMRDAFPGGPIGKTEPLPRVEGDPSLLLGGDSAATPVPYLAQSAWTGSVDCPVSLDGLRRRLPLVCRIGEEVYPSFVLQTLMQWAGAGVEDVHVALGESVTVTAPEAADAAESPGDASSRGPESPESWTIPVDESGFMTLNWRAPEQLPVYEYSGVAGQLIESEDRDPWPEETFPDPAGKIVLVGQSAAGLADLAPTPLSGQREEPLFKVHATALDNILRGDYLEMAPLGWVLAGWLPAAWLSLLPLLLLRRAPVLPAVAVPLVLVALYTGLAYGIFAKESVALPLALPAGGFLLLHALVVGNRLAEESREKKYIRTVFGSYLSPKVVNEIIESGEMPRLGGQETEITMFFSDIQGFSSFSEELSPERLVELMNEYLSAMTEILTDRTGTLDKYIGDAIVGMFGAPLRSDTHARDAVGAAIAMQRRQDELRREWKASGNWPPIVHGMRTRIGLNTGPAVIGNMGSTKQFNYTMMGDNVNLAARCESGAKAYGVHTMITGETRKAAEAAGYGETAKDGVAYRFLDRIVVKGRRRPVEVHEVVDFRDLLGDSEREGLELFAAGMEAYLRQDWAEAIRCFERSAERERWQPGRDEGIHTNPSLVLLDRCREMEKNPPGEDWDGVYRMTTK